MALSFSVSRYFQARRGVRSRLVRVTMDSSYAAGGWAVTPANFSLTGITEIQLTPAGGYVFEYDKAAAKIKAYWGDNNNASDGPLIEIPNNDSGVNTKVSVAHVIGY